MGQARGGGAGHSRGGMNVLLRPDGGAPNSPSQIARQHQTGDLREEMDGSTTMGWRPNLRAEIQATGKPQPGRHDRGEHQEACLAVLPAEGGVLPHRTIPALGQELTQPQCWWCQCPAQTRDRLFKECPKWKGEQKILWAKVRKETGRWKSRWRIRDLFADRRCSQAVLEFLTMTDVGTIVPAAEDEAHAESEGSEWELWERQEREEERGEEAEALGTGEKPPLFLPIPPFMASAREE